MSQDFGTELENIKAHLAAERESRAQERLDRLDQSLRELHQESTEVLNAVKAIEKIQEQLTGLSAELVDTKKRVPPLQTSAAVALVALGLLGWQVKDILKARNEISNLTEPVNQAVASLDASTKSGEAIAQEVGKSLRSLDSSLAESRQLLAKYNEDISGSSTRLSKFDEKLAKLSMQINLLTEQVGRESQALQPKGADDAAPQTLLDIVAAQVEGRGDPLALLAKGTVLLQRGEFRQARSLAIEAKAKHTGAPDSSFDVLIALSYHKEGRYQDAIGAFEKALEIADDDEKKTTILSNMGASYFSWAQSVDADNDREIALLEKAAEIERQARNLTKSRPTVFVNSAVTLNKLKRHNEALAALEEYSGQESAEIDLAFGFTFALLGEKASALDKLSAALRRKPTLAMHALIDDDFAILRADPDFLTILATYLPQKLIDEVRKQAWEKQ